jgi:hypothetical protein
MEFHHLHDAMAAAVVQSRKRERSHPSSTRHLQHRLTLPSVTASRAAMETNVDISRCFRVFHGHDAF